MPVPRERLISLEATPFYHLISRCVRRQFLCGFDADRNLDFSHRREWIRKRLFELSEVFAIDVCAYAILANHYHLVVRVDQESALVPTPRLNLTGFHGLIASNSQRRFESMAVFGHAERSQ